MTTIRKRWIQSFPGNRQVFPLDLDPASVNFRDIAWALSMKCRFTGHVKHFYSVAQHCILGSSLLPPAWKLPFLLHEVSEAYLPDIAGPVKPWVQVDIGTADRPCVISWEALEARHADVILPAIGCGSLRPLIDSPEVKRMDLMMLAAEKEQLLGQSPEEWSLPYPAAEVWIETWTQELAFSRLLAAFRALTGLDPDSKPLGSGAV